MKHGTFGAYSNYGCRCELCKEANRDKMAKWRAGLRECPERSDLQRWAQSASIEEVKRVWALVQDEKWERE